MNNFQGQYLMDFGSVVSIALQVAPNHFLQPLSLNIWPAKTARVQEHFPNISSECISVPDPEMEDLVSSEEEMFEMKSGKGTVYLGHPLRHSHVVGILRFKLDLQETPAERTPKASPFSG